MAILKNSTLYIQKPLWNVKNCLPTQQTRNHFWTSWHVSYWFIIGAAPPVCVFVCIYMNTCVLPVQLLLWVLKELSWARTGTVSLARVIVWKTRDFMGNMCRHTKFVHRIRWIHVNWASWTCEFTYTNRTCEITGRCLLDSFNLWHITEWLRLACLWKDLP